MILLFGAHGQLGNELISAAGRSGIQLVGLGRDEVDIAEPEAVRAAISRIRPSLLINAAAYTKVDKAESEPEAAWRANVSGPDVLAGIADTNDLPLIHISTDYVFDGSKAGAYREDDPVAPLNVYGRSKAAGEAVVRQLAPRHLILRTAWLYSAHGGNFLKTIMRLTREREELRIVADQFGSPTPADEVAQTILAVAPRLVAKEAPFGTYHLASGGVTSWHGFAERIVEAQAEITHRRPKVTPIATVDYPTAARRPANSVLDSTSFARDFGIRLMPWQGSVDRIVAELLCKEAGT